MFAYGEIVFLGFTLSPAAYNPGNVGVLGVGHGYVGRDIVHSTLLDSGADGLEILPIERLVSLYYVSAILPLWNPYMAAGTPLAADTTTGVFSPFRLLILTPYTYDAVFLLRIWLAGVFTLLFLRKLKLGPLSCLSGAIFYMLSGAFTWYSGMSSIDVQLFAPLLLYAEERIMQEGGPVNVSVLSLSVLLTILGGFIETIVLQFILGITYFVFRALTLKRFLKPTVRLGLGFIGGLGLSAFYLSVVFEYLSLASLANGGVEGVTQLPYWLFGTIFVPYIIGAPVQYWSNAMTLNQWVVNMLPGYVGILSLFLSLVSIFALLQYRDRSKLPAAFFVFVGTLTILKIFGTPIINLVGQLPVLQYVEFYKFAGFIISLSFAVSAAYGFESLTAKVNERIIIASALTTVTIIVAAMLALTPFLSDQTPELSKPFVIWGQAMTLEQLRVSYLLWQGAVAGLLVCAGAYLSRKITKNRALAGALVCLIIFEMTWLIPNGMTYVGEFEQSLFMSASVIILCVSVAVASRMSKGVGPKATGINLRLIDRRLLLCVFVVLVLIGQNTLTASSPAGYPSRYDYFQPPPFVTFLQQHAGYERIWSIDNTFASDYAGDYGLQSIGINGAFNVPSFARFHSLYLNSKGLATTIFDSGYVQPGYEVQQLNENQRFYNLLGVRYVIAYSNLTEDLSYPLVYNSEVSIYENPNAYPRAFVVHRYVTAQNYQQAQQILIGLNFDARNEVVLEDPTGQLGSAGVIGNATDNQAYVLITNYTPNDVTLNVSSDGSGILILTDTFYPGWKANIDGKPTTIYRADGLVRAVLIGPGVHVVEFNYSPWSFWAGALISTITLLALSGWITFQKRFHDPK
jgi:hypothetical protein